MQIVVDANHYAALVITDDGTLARLANLGTPIPSFPSLGAPFARLTDKVGLAELCASAGVAYPTTFVPDDASDAERVMSSLAFPLIVKGGQSAVADAEAVRVRKGATVASNFVNALEAYLRLRSEGLRPILQELIHPGLKINVCISRRNGSSEMRFAYRSLRQVQPSGAESAALESISADDGPGALAADALERVCDLAQYEGAANGQCILATDGRLYLIEVNPRLWSSTWFAEKMGLRPTERGVRLALGLASLPKVPYSFGRRFHYLPSEWRWFVRQRRSPRALFELIRSSRPWDIYEGVAFTDPLPTLARLIR